MNGSKATPWTRRHYTDGPFGQIHFQEAGSGQQPLVLLHQVPSCSAQFDNVCDPLVQLGFHVIAIDMPGFGGSDPTPGPPSIHDYACAVEPVLDALGIPRAALLGHHTGALAAHEAALALPDRIAALVLNGPLLVTEEERETFLAGLHQSERRFGPRAQARHMVRLFESRAALADGTVPLERLSDYVVHTLCMRGVFWWGHHAAYMYNQAQRLPLLGQPTLILTNTGDIIHEHARRAHEIRPDFTYIALDGGGIDIVDQQPCAWARAVAGFLASVLPSIRESA